MAVWLIVKVEEDKRVTHKICAIFTREFFGGGKENSSFFANKETEDILGFLFTCQLCIIFS